MCILLTNGIQLTFPRAARCVVTRRDVVLEDEAGERVATFRAAAVAGWWADTEERVLPPEVVPAASDER